MSTLDLIFASVAGNENVDLDKVENIAEVTAEEAAEAVVEAEIKEVEKDVAELETQCEKQETSIDAIEEKVEELQEHVDGLEAMGSGATPFNAAMFAYHFAKGSKIAERFGAKVEHVGAESFADASSANLNAFAGVESMKDTIVKGAGTVKKFFVELYNTFIAMFVGLFNRLKGIEKKAGVLKSQLTGATTKTGKINIPAEAGALLDEKGSAGSAIAAIVSAIGDVRGVVGSNPLVGASKVINDLAKMGTKSTTATGSDIDGLKIKVGATVFAVGAPKTEAGLGKVSVVIKKEGEGIKEINAVDKSALVSLVDSVATNAGKLQSANLDAKNLQKQRDTAIASLEAKSDKEEDKGHAQNVRNAHKAVLKVTKEAVKFGGNILDAQLGFVKAHLGGSAKKEDDKKDDKKDD